MTIGNGRPPDDWASLFTTAERRRRRSRMGDLGRVLEAVDGRPYPAYRDLRGRGYAVGAYHIQLEHVQGDPFAAPSRLRVDVPAGVPQLTPAALDGPHVRRATADFLHRAIDRVLRSERRSAGSGKSGLLEISALGQEVLDRTAVRVGVDGSVVIRLSVGLPAAGRRILGRQAAQLLTTPSAASTRCLGGTREARQQRTTTPRGDRQRSGCPAGGPGIPRAAGLPRRREYSAAAQRG